MRIAELNVRDIQQTALTKDLQHFEMVEKLKDEIRILEGWLFLVKFHILPPVIFPLLRTKFYDNCIMVLLSIFSGIDEIKH